MSRYDGLDLPAGVEALLENSPIEDLVIKILREKIPGLKFRTLIPDLDRVPFAQVRRLGGMGNWQGDSRFVDAGRIQINVFSKDPDGDEKGALISEAIRVVLRDAGAACYHDPQLGSLTRIRMDSEPTRKTDWATSSGPVQYADLPTGHWRYESMYSLRVRKPVSQG